MVAFKFAAVSVLLAGAVSALPTELETRAPHQGDWNCPNKQGALAFTAAHVSESLSRAPSAGGSSGYPHKFNNGYDEKTHKKIPGYTVINFDSKPCNKAPTDNTYLLEFPIMKTAGTYYDANKKPKQDPGPARVIYYMPGKTFCGIVGHEDGNKGDLKLCNKL